MADLTPEALIQSVRRRTGGKLAPDPATSPAAPLPPVTPVGPGTIPPAAQPSWWEWIKNRATMSDPIRGKQYPVKPAEIGTPLAAPVAGTPALPFPFNVGGQGAVVPHAGGVEPHAQPGQGGKFGPPPGSIKTQTRGHWGGYDQWGNQIWWPGDDDYIAPGQERYDEQSGKWYRFKGAGERPQQRNVPPSQRGIFDRLRTMFEPEPKKGGWEVHGDNGWEDIPLEDVPQRISGEKVRGKSVPATPTNTPPTTKPAPPTSAPTTAPASGQPAKPGDPPTAAPGTKAPAATPGAPSAAPAAAPGGQRGRIDPNLDRILRSLPPDLQRLLGGTGGTPNFMDFFNRMLQQAAQGGSAPDIIPPEDEDLSPEELAEGGHNILSRGAGVAPGPEAGGGAAAGPNAAPSTAAATPAGTTGAAPAAMAAGDSATGGVPTPTAAGGPPPLPPVGPVVPPIATADASGILGTPDGGAADLSAAGLAPAAGALGPIGRARAAGAAREARVMDAAATHNFGQTFNPRLATDRERYRIELANDPALRQRFLEVMYNEQGRHPEGVQAIAESALNRASVRKTPLRRQLGWHRWEPHGYYQRGNAGRGMQRHLATLNQALDNALAGSNISNFATDNSSGGLAKRERSSGRFRYRSGYTGESFFAPGWAEPKFARDWDSWMSGMQPTVIAQR